MTVLEIGELFVAILGNDVMLDIVLVSIDVLVTVFSNVFVGLVFDVIMLV